MKQKIAFYENQALMRQMFTKYQNNVREQAKYGAMLEPLKFAEWKSALLEVSGAKGISPYDYTMKDLKEVNQFIMRSSKRQLTRNQTNALHDNLGSGAWADELSSEEAVEVEMFLRERGYYEAAESGNAHQWFAFNGMDLKDLLETLGLASWHMFFNS